MNPRGRSGPCEADSRCERDPDEGKWVTLICGRRVEREIWEKGMRK
jgi:hypothetical protein